MNLSATKIDIDKGEYFRGLKCYILSPGYYAQKYFSFLARIYAAEANYLKQKAEEIKREARQLDAQGRVDEAGELFDKYDSLLKQADDIMKTAYSDISKFINGDYTALIAPARFFVAMRRFADLVIDKPIIMPMLVTYGLDRNYNYNFPTFLISASGASWTSNKIDEVSSRTTAGEQQLVTINEEVVEPITETFGIDDNIWTAEGDVAWYRAHGLHDIAETHWSYTPSLSPDIVHQAVKIVRAGRRGAEKRDLITTSTAQAFEEIDCELFDVDTFIPWQKLVLSEYEYEIETFIQSEDIKDPYIYSDDTGVIYQPEPVEQYLLKSISEMPQLWSWLESQLPKIF